MINTFDVQFEDNQMSKSTKFTRFMKDQIEEIKKHKWIRSEQEHRDLGKSAVEEWINSYAKEFRKYWFDNHKD